MDRWSVTCWDQHLPALWQAAERLKGQFCLSARTYTQTSTVEHAIALETPIFCYQDQLSIVYILTTGYLLSKSSVIFVFFSTVFFLLHNLHVFYSLTFTSTPFLLPSLPLYPPTLPSLSQAVCLMGVFAPVGRFAGMVSMQADNISLYKSLWLQKFK